MGLSDNGVSPESVNRILRTGEPHVARGLCSDSISDNIANVWILTDSRASIQYLSHWISAGDKTSWNILDVVGRLSSRHSIYFQWIRSHIGLNGNGIADSLAKSSTADALQGDACLTFAELSSIKRMELDALRRVPPAHPWYFGRKPRWRHQLNIPKDWQTALSRFFSGPIKSYF
ncbi:uncharacterized protein TNCV_789651 [Trichonephila clavipes]|nr:uncharacterized protein TNCV_789651 [Trichonephila clavipes]